MPNLMNQLEKLEIFIQTCKFKSLWDLFHTKKVSNFSHLNRIFHSTSIITKYLKSQTFFIESSPSFSQYLCQFPLTSLKSSLQFFFQKIFISRSHLSASNEKSDESSCYLWKEVRKNRYSKCDVGSKFNFYM
jgi:hypothetical protein